MKEKRRRLKVVWTINGQKFDSLNDEALNLIRGNKGLMNFLEEFDKEKN